jgi:hypothetical protein
MSRTSTDAFLCGVSLCASASSVVQILNLLAGRTENINHRGPGVTEESTGYCCPILETPRLDNSRDNEYCLI